MKNFLLKTCLFLALLLVIRSVSANVSLVVLGDSLSAGYGLSQEQTWVAELDRRWESSHPDINIINASISGETTRGGLRRLEGVLERHQPDALFIELGGNDGLRGFDLNTVRSNLKQIIDQAQQQGVKVGLSQVMVPPNYGQRFAEQFRKMFEEVAEEKNVTLIPFFMEQIATNPDYVQDDGIHPTAEAQPKIADFLEPYLLELAQ
ncbi:arylesterase [Idiomarina sp. PL1-037]|uniref:arylesterase n=1 Tax=Idiomarina TaxID=135575 RepID=UPI00294AAB63|nr:MULTISPECIES: arylesterase [unclassified Idiomarina]MDV6328696.1 arylesterase [Idiomarina sp. Sol25]WQC52197.1 arylesterase [Idiomarina sp. PL1-037]